MELFTLMVLLTSVLVGVILGAFAKVIKPGKDRGGLILTIVVGVSGSMIGTYFGGALGIYRSDSRTAFIAGIVVATVALFLFPKIPPRTR